MSDYRGRKGPLGCRRKGRRASELHAGNALQRQRAPVQFEFAGGLSGRDAAETIPVALRH